MNKFRNSPHQSGRCFLTFLTISMLALAVRSNGLGQELTETFNTPADYSNNWTLDINNGSGQQINYTAGSLQLIVPWISTYPPVPGFQFSSKTVFSGDVDVTFEFNHQGSGRTNIGLLSEDKTTALALAALDTDDTNYLDFMVPGIATDWKYAGTPYMNGWTTLRVQVVGLQVKFYAGANGAAPVLLETLPLQAAFGKYRIYFTATTVPWKSGGNVTTFRKITAVATAAGGDCKAQIDAANVQVQELTQHVNALAAQNTELTTQVSELSASNAQLQSQLAATNEEKKALTASVADLQTKLGAANTTIQTLSAANTSLQADASALAALMQKLTQVFRVNFNNPPYQIPGSTSIQQLQSVVSAVTDINHGQQQAIYTRMGGSPGK